MRTVFDPADPDIRCYPLLTALVVPRPIAWVTTVSGDGTANLAPHSFFTVACANPPIVSFTSVGEKDTLRNVEETGEFV
ncbi:MAG: flavin reductase family protein, partial [Pseudonocardia sp.]